MTLVDRFLKYVSFDTQSDESTGLTPSTPKQMVFAEYLKTELESLGLEDITLDEHGYLFATLPANIDKKVPTIGFIAHMDTSPDMTGKDVTPRIVKGYDGTDIVLCAEENIILSPAQFPELLDHIKLSGSSCHNCRFRDLQLQCRWNDAIFFYKCGNSFIHIHIVKIFGRNINRYI